MEMFSWLRIFEQYPVLRLHKYVYTRSESLLEELVVGEQFRRKRIGKLMMSTWND